MKPLSIAISVVVRVAVQLLGEDAAAARDAAHLLGDVHGQTDRPALLGERARDGLANPPGRVGRELEAHLVVELLDGADQAEVALLDQVEERDAGLRVVPRDRHHEPEIALDQPSLRRLVALVLAPGELALLGGRQQAAVADLAHVELERILRRLGDGDGRVLGVVGLLGLDLLGILLPILGLVERRQQLEMRLRGCLEDRLGGVRLHPHRYRRARPAA